MNVAFYSEPVEQAIVQEIMQWSAVALEKPSSHFNDLPPCPYARAAWLDNKVSVRPFFEVFWVVLEDSHN